MKKYRVALMTIFVCLSLVACREEEPTDLNHGCNGCPKDAMFTAGDSKTCYSSLSDCEATEGTKCDMCYP